MRKVRRNRLQESEFRRFGRFLHRWSRLAAAGKAAGGILIPSEIDADAVGAALLLLNYLFMHQALKIPIYADGKLPKGAGAKARSIRRLRDDYQAALRRGQQFVLILIDGNDIRSPHLCDGVDWRELPAPRVIVDHHPAERGRPRAKRCIELRYPGAGSSSVIVLEFLRSLSLLPQTSDNDRRTAIATTYALAGIMIDGHLEPYELYLADELPARARAFMPWLVACCNRNLYRSFGNDPKLLASLRRRIKEGRNQLRRLEGRGVLTRFVGAVRSPHAAGLMSSVADALKRTAPKSSVVLVVGIDKQLRHLRFVLRQQGRRFDLHRLAQGLLPQDTSGKPRGGGRRTAAAARLPLAELGKKNAREMWIRISRELARRLSRG